MRPARERPADRDRPRRDRRGADRARRHGDVHRLDAHRPQGRRSGCQAPDPGFARARRQGPDDRAAPTPTSSARPTSRPTTRCRTPARRASRSSAYTSRSRCTTSSSRKCPTKCASCASARPEGGTGSVEVGAITFPPQLDIISDHVDDAVQKGRARPHGRPPGPGRRPLLRADGARRRRPLDEDHDRGDVRADAADHEGRRRRGGDAALQRHRRTASARRCSRATPTKGEQIARRIEAGRGERQRRPDQLHGARAADGRRQGVRAGFAPRRGRDPQVLLAAGDRRDPAWR